MPLRSDPRRLPRRNHYQEGPDFLFLATQGGHPLTGTSAVSPVLAVRRRARALHAWRDGEPIETVCAQADCSRATLFRWRDRFETDGIAGLLDRPRPGDHTDLAPELERAIVIVRLLSYWNSRRIAAELGRRGITVSHSAIERLLARHGTSRPSVARVPGPRYERGSPNELWHVDLKGPFFFQSRHGPVQSCHFVALVDDFSRFLVGVRALPTRHAAPILATLEEAMELCGVPLALMSDNGTPFVILIEGLLTRFQRTLAELSIRHIRTQIDTPWTNGKVEAFWATLQAEVLDRQRLADLAAAETAVTAYASYYNYHRLHGALDWHTPAERFDGTPFTDRGFEHVPSLAPVADLLAELLAA
jgi:transposase InsO family protein